MPSEIAHVAQCAPSLGYTSPLPKLVMTVVHASAQTRQMVDLLSKDHCGTIFTTCGGQSKIFIFVPRPIQDWRLCNVEMIQYISFSRVLYGLCPLAVLAPLPPNDLQE